MISFYNYQWSCGIFEIIHFKRKCCYLHIVQVYIINCHQMFAVQFSTPNQKQKKKIN